jgi:hypothetical protein
MRRVQRKGELITIYKVKNIVKIGVILYTIAKVFFLGKIVTYFPTIAVVTIYVNPKTKLFIPKL